MLNQYATPEVAEKIARLFSAMKGHDTSDVVAKDINDILIFGDKIPSNIVSSAWDLFAQKNGVKK